MPDLRDLTTDPARIAWHTSVDERFAAAQWAKPAPARVVSGVRRSGVKRRA